MINDLSSIFDNVECLDLDFEMFLKITMISKLFFMLKM